MALVISRKDEESVFIGDDIRITVLIESSSQAKLVIEAPEDVEILREELLNRRY